ncbi:dipeptide/oligopeptide/nickel ABC transporter permease/ATP-binding protein [Micromonospora sp. WMMD1102]|uniref:dipeptide/oligopeptide/nickel ABC transporter permease/ATP-binding protein n=1 Tax=Micromonospora sp. WMMD1102 TaxID=3016105 RepID=UPI002414F48D|nr:dipeptide/oligopeptide/nickel ABC transporter permease/ATP-binding protein [Micromonospora sp. WMMD1102]MDG4787786.1 dipeptide/oligopeptide/nickel ABC transporter permease/ATP-binding protein [Micromonospora sp. WMMD1102]
MTPDDTTEAAAGGGPAGTGLDTRPRGMRPGLASRLSRPGIRFRRLGLPSWISVAVLSAIALAALLAPLIAPHSPYVQEIPGGGPSATHWMGLDSANRDILTRLLHGARWSLLIGLGATAIALAVGAVVGAVAATSRRAVDEALMRGLDVVMAFPGIALAAVLVAVFGGGIGVLVLAIAFLYVPSVARVVRANVLAQYGEDYVAAERVIGARTPHILVRHVAVNCAAPILVFCTVMVADAIVFEASLSFIGAGVRPPAPSWGSVIADGRNMVLLGGWWATVFPGLLILVTVLALNILAEGVSDAWAAPAGRQAEPVRRSEDVDALEQARPGSREVTPLPGLAAAARRIAERARPLPQGEPILRVSGLAVGFDGRHDDVDIVAGISFDVRPGEVLGLVGESGCGKSLTALTVMGLQPRGARVRGEIRFGGQDLLALSPAGRRRLLGHDMAMIYQDALSSLNPAMTIRAQLKQIVRRGGRRTPVELLELVGLDPARTLSAYPHELSGGQRQRVLIAMALSRDPRLIIADEPTTALDVTVQAQVIQLLLRLRAELGFALILVSHDLALVADVTDRVVVMYGGQIVESGVTATLVGAPAHHYARGLLGSVLSLETGADRLTQIRGVVPSPADFPAGCRFADRCPMATEVCRVEPPRLVGAVEHAVACHHPALEIPPPPDVGHESQGAAVPAPTSRAEAR